MIFMCCKNHRKLGSVKSTFLVFSFCLFGFVFVFFGTTHKPAAATDSGLTATSSFAVLHIVATQLFEALDERALCRTMAGVCVCV